MADFRAPSSALNTGLDEKAGGTANVKAVGDEKRDNVVFIERLHTDLTSDSFSDPETPDSKHEAVETDLQLVTRVLSVDDDPSENPWTFRMWFLGLGFGVFTATTSTVNHFKPQPMAIHFVFIVVIAYVFGKFLEKTLPSRGRIGKILNPGPFNKKEHTAICILAGSAGSTPEAMMALAVQKLWYNMNPSPGIAVILVLSAQMLGYGMAGLLRSTLVYPTKMLYPSNIPAAALLDNLHRNKQVTKKKLRVFYIGFAALFAYQAFPQYIMPILGGVSIFCISMPNNLLVTNFFGGSMANEGLGILSLSFDWQFIGGGQNPMWMPYRTLVNEVASYLISIGIYMGLYYGNVWQALKFPFLSPMLYSEKSTAKKFVPYNTTAILNKKMEVEPTLLEKYGLPYKTSASVFATTGLNAAISSTFVHMFLWHYQDLKSAWSFVTIANFKKLGRPKEWNLKFWTWKNKPITREEADAIDPHYGLMTVYKDIPQWWFGVILVLTIPSGLMACYWGETTLPWWGFAIAIGLSATCLPFFAAQTAMFGFSPAVQPLIQLIGAYLIPGKPVANMYFATYGFNSLYQAKFLLRDLKLGQYTHLPPRCTFATQMIGTAMGCIISYFMMEQVVEQKQDILRDIQGTNVWSGQQLQGFNSAAVTWGGLAKYMYTIGSGRYQIVAWGYIAGLFLPIPLYLLHQRFPKVRFDRINMAIVLGYVGALAGGTHSGMLMKFALGFFAQVYLRKYRPNWFVKYNYILSAGLDGGTSLINFILTFTVFGGGPMKTRKFPPYWGNNWQKGNYDMCMRNPALGKKHQ